MSTTDYYEYNTIEDELCHKEAVIKFGANVTPVFFWVMVFLSFVGNTLVLVILIKYENLKSLTHIFILNLALSDLIFTFGLPFWAYYHIYGWRLGDVACKMINFIFYVGFYSSIMFLTLMTIHRYMAVVRPLSDFGSKKFCYAVASSAVIWMLSLLAATPVLIFCKVQEVPQNFQMLFCEYDNIDWKIASNFLQNCVFLFAMSIICFCYIKILGTLLRSRRSNARFRTIKLIFVIVLVFFLSWAPYNVTLFLRSLTDWGGVYPFNVCSVSKAVDYAFCISRLTAYSHCWLNPVFYVFVGQKFQAHLQKMFWKLGVCKTAAESQSSFSRTSYNSM